MTTAALKRLSTHLYHLASSSTPSVTTRSLATMAKSDYSVRQIGVSAGVPDSWSSLYLMLMVWNRPLTLSVSSHGRIRALSSGSEAHADFVQSTECSWRKMERSSRHSSKLALVHCTQIAESGSSDIPLFADESKNILNSQLRCSSFSGSSS